MRLPLSATPSKSATLPSIETADRAKHALTVPLPAPKY
jgi:hypothetical protein